MAAVRLAILQGHLLVMVAIKWCESFVQVDYINCCITKLQFFSYWYMTHAYCNCRSGPPATIKILTAISANMDLTVLISMLPTWISLHLVELI